MKRFLASIVLFSLLFSHVWGLFQIASADDLVELTEDQVSEEIILDVSGDTQDRVQEEYPESDQEEIWDQENILEEDEVLEHLLWEDESEEDISQEEDIITEESNDESVEDNINIENDISKYNKNEENINNNWDKELSEESEGIEQSEEEHMHIDNSDETLWEGINMNTATHEELKSIKWIWNSTAQNIINYREESPFCDIEELLNVSWVWLARLEDIKESWYVDPDDCVDDTADLIDDVISEDGEEIWDEQNNQDIWNTQENGEELEQESEELWDDIQESETVEWADNEDMSTWWWGWGGETWGVLDSPWESELVGNNKEIKRIHINFATSEELISIRGIWPSLASNIIAYREENLLCRSDDLLKVHGIGTSILSNILEVWYVSHPDCPDDLTWSESEIDQNFSIIYEFQRPTDITAIADSIHAYDCDRSRQDCRVNLDYRVSFTAHFPAREYTCLSDFWFWVITWEEEKCNPNTIVFPVWTHEVSIKVQEKSWDKNIYEQRFTVRNLWYLPQEERVQLAALSWEKVWNIDIRLPRIIVQSGLEAMDETGKFFRCLKKDCKINLDYKTWHRSERCLWNFWVWVLNHPTTHTRCNPWIVTFPEWDHELSLTVYENRFEANRREFIFFVNNIWDEIDVQNIDIDKDDNNKNDTDIFDVWNIDIHLQWRIGKEKEYDEEAQVLRCVWVERCSVNLIWKIENSKRWLIYLWYKNDDVFFENINPPADWLDTWEYEILFEIYDGSVLIWSSVFFVIVEWKENSKNAKSQKEVVSELYLFDTLMHDGIIIYDFLADPLGSDMKEFIDIKNTHSEARDLYGCYLEDNGRRKFRFPEWLYLDGWQIQRFFRVETRMVLWNTKWRISLFCNNEEVQNISWNTKVREGITLRWNSVWVFQPQYLREKLNEEMYERYVQNMFAFSARALKYDGLRVRGEVLPHSTLTWYIDGQRFFTLTTGSSGRYTFDTKQIHSGKHQVDFTLTDMFWDTFELQSRTFTLQADRMTHWHTPRPWSTPRVPTLRIISQASADRHTETWEYQNVILRRFFLYSLLIFVALIGIWHLFLLAFPPTMALRELQVRTKVRTELIFLLP